jgi:hypothetical protein
MTMDKKIAGLLGAVGALASLDTAQATIPTDSTTMLKAQSYADLLNPIPNAAAILKAADEAGDTSGVRVAENAHHHHHHHHHSYYLRDRISKKRHERYLASKKSKRSRNTIGSYLRHARPQPRAFEISDASADCIAGFIGAELDGIGDATSLPSRHDQI